MRLLFFRESIHTVGEVVVPLVTFASLLVGDEVDGCTVGDDDSGGNVVGEGLGLTVREGGPGGSVTIVSRLLH